jgi:hypothetical protein
MAGSVPAPANVKRSPAWPLTLLVPASACSSTLDSGWYALAESTIDTLNKPLSKRPQTQRDCRPGHCLTYPEAHFEPAPGQAAGGQHLDGKHKEVGAPVAPPPGRPPSGFACKHTDIVAQVAVLALDLIGAAPARSSTRDAGRCMLAECVAARDIRPPAVTLKAPPSSCPDHTLNMRLKRNP